MELLEEKETGSGFDIKRFLLKLLSNYAWLIASLLIFLIMARLYLRYQVPLYQISTHILINAVQLQTDPNNVLSGAGLLGGSAGSSGNEVGNINNEIFILQSSALMYEVSDSLNLDLSVSTYGLIKNQPIYIDSLPFYLAIHKLTPAHQSPLYKLTLQKTYYTLEDKNLKVKGFYTQPLILNGDTFLINIPQPSLVRNNAEYGIKLNSINETVNKYLSRLTIAPIPKAGTGMLQVAVRDELPDRAKNIIDVLIYQYNLANLQFRNQATRMALYFLNNRLSAVEKELQEQENAVRDFKVKNKIYDVSTSASQLLTDLSDIDAKKSQNKLQEQLLNLVETNVKSYTQREEIVPNASGLEDPVLLDLINRYNDLVLKKRMILDQGTALDPRLEALNGQLEEIRTNVIKNVANIHKQLTTSNSYLSSQENNFTSRFESLPEKEKEYIEINRTLGIKENLYTFLLQKREETNLQLISSDVNKSRTIDEGLNNGIVQPETNLIYLIALAAGLLLPTSVILITFLVNNKIETKKEIENSTSLPIVGEIGLADDINAKILISDKDRSPIAEQFRALRTNLSYLGAGTSQKVLLITSFMSGEGKSFISLNLAKSLAISNKKVVVVELDLRKPKLSEKLGVKNETGITNFLINEIEPGKIIRKIENFPDLSLVSCGTIPPNPGELILNARLKVLIDYLKQHFDYVILDTPPVGMVSDALILSAFADISLYILRHNFSLRSSIRLINELSEDKKLPSVSLIINGIQRNKGFNYGYSYGYGYGYGYGYSYNESENGEKKNKFNLRKLLKLNK